MDRIASHRGDPVIQRNAVIGDIIAPIELPSKKKRSPLAEIIHQRPDNIELKAISIVSEAVTCRG